MVNLRKTDETKSSLVDKHPIRNLNGANCASFISIADADLKAQFTQLQNQKL